MALIDSYEAVSKTDKGTQAYSGIYELDGVRNGSSIVIQDERIINEEIADIVARATFLEEGYTRQEVGFTAYFNDVKINDVISIYAPIYRIPRELNRDKFLVKSFEIQFSTEAVKSNITAVRYDV